MGEQRSEEWVKRARLANREAKDLIQRAKDLGPGKESNKLITKAIKILSKVL